MNISHDRHIVHRKHLGHWHTWCADQINVANGLSHAQILSDSMYVDLQQTKTWLLMNMPGLVQLR